MIIYAALHCRGWKSTRAGTPDVLSGLPAGVAGGPGIQLNLDLHRRQLGEGRGGRQKIEKDRADVFAGVRHGQTIGAPIALRIENRDWANWEKILPVEASSGAETGSRKLVAPRPGHADLAGSQKFNFHDARYVLERASARRRQRRAIAALVDSLNCCWKQFGCEIARSCHIQSGPRCGWNVR